MDLQLEPLPSNLFRHCDIIHLRSVTSVNIVTSSDPLPLIPTVEGISHRQLLRHHFCASTSACELYGLLSTAMHPHPYPAPSHGTNPEVQDDSQEAARETETDHAFSSDVGETTARTVPRCGLEHELLPAINTEEPTVFTQNFFTTDRIVNSTPTLPACNNAPTAHRSALHGNNTTTSAINDASDAPSTRPTTALPPSSTQTLPRTENTARPRTSMSALPPRPPARLNRSASHQQQPPISHPQFSRSGGSPAQRTDAAQNRNPSRSPTTTLTSLQRLLNSANYDIAHFDPRITAQMRYIDKSSISGLSGHTAAVKRLFMSLVDLQLKLPPTSRFHLFFEREHSSGSTQSEFTAYDLFSLFSPTVSTESRDRRGNISMIGEIIAEFKLLCDSERPSPSNEQHTSSMHTAVEAQGHACTTTPNNPPDVRRKLISNTDRGSSLPQPTASPDDRERHCATHTGTAATGASTDADDDYDDAADLNQDWFIPDEALLAKKTLPDWFPSPDATLTSRFKLGKLVVPIDRYRLLSYEQGIFVYRTLLRIAHKKSLLNTERPKYDKNPHFKHVFNFKTFNPPWFVASIDCTVDGKSLFSKPLHFDDPSIPTMRLLRSKTSRVILEKIHTLIACFYIYEPAFAAASIDFIMHKSKKLLLTQTGASTSNNAPTAQSCMIRNPSPSLQTPSLAAPNPATAQQSTSRTPSPSVAVPTSATTIPPSFNQPRSPSCPNLVQNNHCTSSSTSSHGNSSIVVAPVPVQTEDDTVDRGPQPPLSPTAETGADPGSPMDEMMAAFHDRSRRLSAKRKRVAAAGLPVVEGNIVEIDY